MYKYSNKSLSLLEHVHPDLQKVMLRAIELSEVDFGITEGLRSQVRQQELLAEGASWTLNSRHLTGHAVDVVAYVEGIGYTYDNKHYKKIADAIYLAAFELGVAIKWGGLFKGNDDCHFELHWNFYPK